MQQIEETRKMLQDVEKKKNDFYERLRRNYDIDENEVVEEFISDAEVWLAWYERRDEEFYERAMGILSYLEHALIELNSNNKKVLHNGRKDIETIIHDARGFKKYIQKNVLEMEQTIEIMDRILGICDEVRKN